MDDNSSITVPEPTLRRMPSYLEYLKLLERRGDKHVSAPTIAKALDLDATQVAKDLAYTSITGRTRVGYEVAPLVQALRDFLHMDQRVPAFLFGVGKLGSALLQYQGFVDFGLDWVAAFDPDERLAGCRVGEVEVLHPDAFRAMAPELGAKVAVLCVPAEVAQITADMVVGWGVTFIWNFSLFPVKVPKGVFVQQTSMYSNLVVLLNRLHGQKLEDQP